MEFIKNEKRSYEYIAGMNRGSREEIVWRKKCDQLWLDNDSVSTWYIVGNQRMVIIKYL